MSNVIGGFEQLAAMKTLSNNMKNLLEVVEQANNVYSMSGDPTLNEPTAKLRETVRVIHDTQEMMLRFHKGEITLEDLEAFRDKVAAMRPCE